MVLTRKISAHSEFPESWVGAIDYSVPDNETGFAVGVGIIYGIGEDGGMRRSNRWLRFEVSPWDEGGSQAKGFDGRNWEASLGFEVCAALSSAGRMGILNAHQTWLSDDQFPLCCRSLNYWMWCSLRKMWSAFNISPGGWRRLCLTGFSNVLNWIRILPKWENFQIVQNTILTVY